MQTLALFDIDNTLIAPSPGHGKSFSLAFKKVYGVDTSIDLINPHGMTDQEIIIEVLKKNGLDDEEIKSKMVGCMNIMVESFNKSLEGEEINVLSGVRELLNTLDRHNVLLGLVTGNLEAIARGKLTKAGINEYFKVGGFGSDHLVRIELVRIAIRKAIEQFNFEKNNNIFLFGDTPLDIKSGNQAGVRTIGVATGQYSEKQLKVAGAEFVLDNLEKEKQVLEILSS